MHDRSSGIDIRSPYKYHNDEYYNGFNVSDIKHYLFRRAPLAGIVLSPFLQIFGNDVNVARLVNVLISSLS